MLDLVTAFFALFAIVEPIGAIPTVLALTHDYSREERRATIYKAVFVAGGVLIAFAVAGQFIFSFFGFTIAAFQIGGGALLFKVAWDMMHGQRPKTKITQADDAEAAARTQIGIAPLGIPLLAGPGAITTVIIYMSGPSVNAFDRLLLLGLIVAVMAITFVILLGSERIYRYLGDSGTLVVVKVFGLILAAIAVQFILNGIRVEFLVPH
jgi:multiple antibiotic resistance protein